MKLLDFNIKFILLFLFVITCSLHALTYTDSKTLATILNQTAQTSIRAGLAASIDAGLQIGSQIYDMTSNGINFSNQNVLDIGNKMINNANNIKFSNFKLDYSSVLYSGITTATTIPTIGNSIKSIMYSNNAKTELKNQLKNTMSKTRQDKINQNINKHNKDIVDNVIFQGTSIGTKILIKEAVIDSKGNNE